MNSTSALLLHCLRSASDVHGCRPALGSDRATRPIAISRTSLLCSSIRHIQTSCRWAYTAPVPSRGQLGWVLESILTSVPPHSSRRHRSRQLQALASGLALL